MGSRLNRYRFFNTVHSNKIYSKLSNLRQLFQYLLPAEMTEVYIYIILAVYSSAFINFRLDRAVDYISRSQFHFSLCILLHESLAFSVYEIPAFTPCRL